MHTYNPIYCIYLLHTQAYSNSNPPSTVKTAAVLTLPNLLEAEQE